MCSFVYISVIIYCIFKERLVPDIKVKISNDRIQQWILFEIGTFFGWLLASAMFMQFMYWTKFTSVWRKNSENLKLDHIWSLKNTRDIAHFMKFEHDLFCLIGSDIVLHVVTIFIFNDEFTKARDYVHYALIILFRFIMLMATYRHLITPTNCVHGIPENKFWPALLFTLVALYVWFCIDL